MISMDPTATDPRNRAAIVPLEFWTDYEPDQEKPGSVKPVDWVKWAKKGTNMSETADKVSRVQKHSPLIWREVEPAYNAWKKGQEVPVDGTPLAAWPGISRAQADKLKLMNIRTVEDVANMTDSDKDRFGMGGLDLIMQARAFVKTKAEKSVIQAELADRDKLIAEQGARIEELLEAVKMLQSDEDKPKRPGRPKKSPDGEADAA